MIALSSFKEMNIVFRCSSMVEQPTVADTTVNKQLPTANAWRLGVWY